MRTSSTAMIISQVWLVEGITTAGMSGWVCLGMGVVWFCLSLWIEHTHKP